MEKSAFYSLLLYVALLFARPGEYLPFIAPLRLVLLASILSTLLFIVSGAYKRISFMTSTNEETRWIVILTVWILLTMPFSLAIGRSLYIFYYLYLGGLILYFMLAYLVNSKERLRKVVNISMIAISVVIINAAYCKITGSYDASEDYGRLGGLGGTFGSSNLLGFIVVLMMPFYFFSLFTEQKPFKRCLLLGMLILSIIVLFSTGSRGGFLGFMAVSAIALKDLVKFNKQKAFILCVIALCLGMCFVSDAYIERISTIFFKVNKADSSYVATSQAINSSDARRGTVEFAKKLIAQYPIFGTGMGNFKEGSTIMQGRGHKQNSHVTYMDYAAELGIPALVIYLLLLYTAITSIRKVIKNIKKHKDNKNIYALLYTSLALKCSLFSYVVMCTFIDVGYEFYLFFIIGLIAAIRKIVTKEVMDTDQNRTGIIENYKLRTLP